MGDFEKHYPTNEREEIAAELNSDLRPCILTKQNTCSIPLNKIKTILAQTRSPPPSQKSNGCPLRSALYTFYFLQTPNEHVLGLAFTKPMKESDILIKR